MISDIIHVSSEEADLQKALALAEACSTYRGLSPKDAVHIRLLTEEMMGLVHALTGQREADFWIESTDLQFRLHLCAEAALNTEMRKKLLDISTSGKNVAAKGLMGKIRDLFERAMEPADGDPDSVLVSGAYYNYASEFGDIGFTNSYVWSLNRYRENVKTTQTKKPEWDELEKSVVANIADEIVIGIKKNTVEMVIYKTFQN